MSFFVYLAMAAAVLFFTLALAQGEDTVYVANPTIKILRFAEAIGFAEGAWDKSLNPKPANRAYRNNNPGDFLGEGDAGTEAGYAKYSTLDKGKQRLFGQLQMIVDGKSHIYNLDMTISDMAYQWTATEQDGWSENVASYLGVTRDTGIRELLA